jgi:signal transduction histidine kinase
VTDVIRSLLRPWHRSTWSAFCHTALDIWLGAVTFSVTITFLALSAGLLVTFPLALPAIWLLFTCARGFARMERSRIGGLLGVEIPDPVRPLQPGSWFNRLSQRWRSGARWKEVGYSLLLLPLGALTLIVSAVSWCASLALLGLPFYVHALPNDTAHFGIFEVDAGGPAWLAAAIGLVGVLLIAPWATLAMGRLDAGVGRSLLGPSDRDELAARATRAETGRVAAVDAAETERRRIERDLHDGAQQRLVALAMDLGAARERLEADPEGGRALVAEAHEEAKAALKEIRDLVRGIHPVILEDRGLDAALSAVVARCPFPVDLRIEVAPRPAPAVESAAYFVVSEALTNVTRHAGATRARVDIARSRDRLVIEVHDDGRGGAEASRGTGLRGLQERVAALGGRMDVISPPGGPTTLLVELPCGPSEAAEATSRPGER